MKRVLIGVVAAAALGGCAYGHGPGGYGPGPGPVAYDAYYDDFYGPFEDGYWDGDAFYYRTGPDHHFARDDGHHFSHVAGAGMHGVHFHGGGGDHGGGHGHG